MRVVSKTEQRIGYRLNLIGIRVFRDYCQIAARVGDDWVPIGSPRPLPVIIPDDISSLGNDALLVTAFQYDQERPGSDLRDVLAQRKDFDQALNDDYPESEAGAA